MVVSEYAVRGSSTPIRVSLAFTASRTLLRHSTFVSEEHQANKSEVAPGRLMDSQWQVGADVLATFDPHAHRHPPLNAMLLVPGPVCTYLVPITYPHTSTVPEAGPLYSISPITGPRTPLYLASPITGPHTSLNPHSLFFPDPPRVRKMGPSMRPSTSFHETEVLSSGRIGIPISLQRPSLMQVIKTKPRLNIRTSIAHVTSTRINPISAPLLPRGRQDG